MRLDGGRAEDVAGEVLDGVVGAGRPAGRRPRCGHRGGARRRCSPSTQIAPRAGSRHPSPETTHWYDRRLMKLGAFFFGGVELDDAGAGPPAPMDRRITNEQAWKATTDYVSSAMEAERLGYDSFWTTEHHFQHEGYEVIPNGILLSTWIAARTSRLRLGTMFNVVPQWNPLRLAEDFATLHNLSGGRAILGVGRGTVPREVLHLNDKGVSIGSHDNPEQAADDERNREVFEESMDIVRRALDQESFSYEGEHFQIPVPGIPDRGSTVQHAHAGAPAAVPVRDLAGRHQPADAGVRAGRRARRGVLEPALLVHQAVLGHVRRALRRRPRRGAGARATSGCWSCRSASRTPSRRPSRRRRPATTSSGSSSGRTAGAAATWARRQAGQAGADPDARRVDREQDDPAGQPGRRRRGRAVLPRPARRRAPDDLPAPHRRPLQEGRRADGPLRRGGRPARCPDHPFCRLATARSGRWPERQNDVSDRRRCRRGRAGRPRRRTCRGRRG